MIDLFKWIHLNSTQAHCLQRESTGSRFAQVTSALLSNCSTPPPSPILFPSLFDILIPEVAPKWCCGSSSPADPEIGVSAPGGGGVGVGAPATPQARKSGRVKRMVRLAAELLLLLGLLLLTLHITVLRSSPLPQGNVTLSLDSALTEVSGGGGY